MPFDQMRTRLLQQMRANGWHRVAITSPTPGCGKSTIALNLALSLSRQSDLRADREAALAAMQVELSLARAAAERRDDAGMATALDRIEAEYDPSVLIFDMPPMFVSDDAMAVMGRMDCVLIIAAAEATTIKDIDRCERDLAGQTNVLGVVLNKCRYMETEGYGYDYHA